MRTGFRMMVEYDRSAPATPAEPEAVIGHPVTWTLDGQDLHGRIAEAAVFGPGDVHVRLAIDFPGADVPEPTDPAVRLFLGLPLEPQ